MASIRIDAGIHLLGREREVMSAVSAATFKPLELGVAHNDVVMICHDATTRQIAEGKSEQFCLIEVKTIAGRSDQQKQDVRTSICQALSNFGIADSDVKVIVVEIPRVNLGH